MCKKLIYLIPFVLVPCLVLTSSASAELLGWWKLDEGEGTIAKDSAGNNDGALMGDTTWVEGVLDGALQFDGNGDYIDCGNDPVFIPSGSFSFTIWAYISDWGSPWGRSMFSKGGDADAAGRMGWSIRRYSDDTLCFTTAGVEGVGTLPDADDNTNMNSNTAPPMNEWFHIACVYDVNNMTYIYINGIVERKRAATGTVINGAGDPNVYIGTRSNGGGTAPDDWSASYFNGMLDDARFYDHALSQTDVRLIMEGKQALPPILASNPKPSYGATDVPRDVVLSWEAGLYAEKHDVYFGTDFNDVNEASRDNQLDVLVSQGQEDTNYYPGLLDFGQTYFWRVDEVNDVEPDSPWKGITLNFTVANFVEVDDFEIYDAGENQIWYTWKDGYGYGTPGTPDYYPGNGTGSAVGDENSPTYMETGTVHGGEQSCPLMYNNSAAPFYSEIMREWDAAQDWTADDVVTLTLWFNGDEDNPAEPLYIEVEDSAGKSKLVTHGDASAVKLESWQQWDIALSQFSDAGVDLTAVNKMVIGVGYKAAPQMGGVGFLLFDDIRLYRP